MKHHLDNLKNFGFRGETVVEEPGINAKLNEIQAAYGLLQLKHIDQFIARRKEISLLYQSLLKDIPGITVVEAPPEVTHNYSYFPIIINERIFGLSRDAVYEKLKAQNILSRRYFYPLISEFSPYNQLPSADVSNLPVAKRVSDSILCLPIYVELSNSDVVRIVNCIL
jgi:dTDP-4-amino-4,6-dideoxygalactose transaminase